MTMTSIAQFLWPRTWRLAKDTECDTEALALANFLAGRTAPPADDAGGPGPAARGCRLSEGQVSQLCTQLFRMERNASQLGEKDDCRQTRSLARGHQQVRKVLAECEIDFKDLGGETYHPGRKDIEVLAADESPDVDRAKIDKCESPLVLIGGEIVQKAKGTVLRPPTPPSPPAK